MAFDFLGDAKKVVIAMTRIGVLPGAPLYDADGGVDAVMFGNENDRPYVFKATPEGVAAMSAMVQAAKPHLKTPDPAASVAIAAATVASRARDLHRPVRFSA